MLDIMHDDIATKCTSASSSLQTCHLCAIRHPMLINSLT